LVAYVLVRLGYDAFYDYLQLRAEDVGLTYQAVITRTALVALALVALPAAQTFAWWETVRRLTVSKLVCLLTVAPLATLALIELATQLYEPGSWVFTGITMGFLVIMAYLAWVMGNYGKWDQDQANPVARRSVPVFFVLVLLIGTLSAISRWGQSVAQHVQRGESVQVPDVLRTVFDFRADKVCAVWSGDKPASLDLTRPLLLMGQANGEVVLYRPQQQSSAASSARMNGPVRLPTDKVSVTPAGENQTSCSSP
jgi:hypothetical protein